MTVQHPAPRHWLAVASAEHVRRGRAEGFMQVCHGKCAPLKRIRPGDLVSYYSPTVHFGGKDRLQAFTAIGTVRSAVPYQVDMGEGFCLFRHDVDWLPAAEAPIAPLLPRLSFSADRPNWGQALRFGLLALTAADMALIAGAMRAELSSRAAH